jgi:hypothetical protein
MKWYYQVRGGHTHVRVFMNGGKCGDLCFRNEEFDAVVESCPWIQFVSETEHDEKLPAAKDSP